MKTNTRLCKYQDWQDMKIGDKGYLDNVANVIIIRVPYGWIYSESYYCEKLDTVIPSNTFIPFK